MKIALKNNFNLGSFILALLSHCPIFPITDSKREKLGLLKEILSAKAKKSRNSLTFSNIYYAPMRNITMHKNIYKNQTRENITYRACTCWVFPAQSHQPVKSRPRGKSHPPSWPEPKAHHATRRVLLCQFLPTIWKREWIYRAGVHKITYVASWCLL